MEPVAVILRHPDENLSKCSVQPLVGRSDLRILEASPGMAYDGTGHVLLEVGAPTLGPADAGHPLLLLDGNWKHVPWLRNRVTGSPLPRSLPKIPSAYPRRNAEGADPEEGLATVEALYLALRLLGRDDPSLLAAYRWREAFLTSVRQHLG